MKSLSILERAGLVLCSLAFVPAAATAQAPSVGCSLSEAARSVALARREVRASTFSQSAQQCACVGLGADGTTVVAWESRRQRNGYTGVYFQRFDTAGRAVGGETPIHAAEGPQHQRAPAIACGADGAEWAVWEQQSGVGSRIVGRRIDGAGTEPVVLANDGNSPSVTVLSDGGAVVAWQTTKEVQLQRVGRDGAPLGDRSSASAGERGHVASVAALSDGGFVVVWSALRAEGFEPDGLRARVYAADGTAGEPVAFDGGVRRGSIEPSVAASGDGGFAVAWMDCGDGADRYDVRMARFDARGVQIGASATVAAAEQYLSGATIAFAADDSGRSCVTWNASEATVGTTDGDIWMRTYGADGRPTGDAFRASVHTDGDQQIVSASSARALAFGRDGRIALAWSGDGGRGDRSAVQVTWLAPRDAAIAAALTEEPLPAPVEPTKPAAELLAGGSVDLGRAETIGNDPFDPPEFSGTLPQTRGPIWAEDSNGFIAITNTGWTPPDTVAAVGPNHVAVLVNGGVGFFTKTGARTFFQSLNAFLGVPSSTFVFDPRVEFDTTSGRWFCAAAEHVGSSQGFFTIAVSDDDDPNGAWFKYRLDVTAVAGTYFIDFPQLGITQNEVYLTSNNFPGGSFANHMIYILPKAPMLSGGAVTARWTISTQTASVSTGTHVGASQGPYFVNASSGTLRIWSIRNPLTAPTLVSANVPIASFSSPGTNPQVGTTTRLSSVDTRMSILQVRNGRLWVCHNTNNPVVTRWYEVNLGNWPTSGAPTLVQQGVISAGSAGIFLPSIEVDAYGNAVVCAAKSSSTETPSIVYYWRNKSDALGTMRGPVVVRQSAASYTRSTRWGDYSAVQLDPRDGATFWLTHEYAADASNWSTYVEPVRIQAPTFTADTAVVTAASGGVVNFSLDNPAWANRNYLILAGASGTAPGTRLPSPYQFVNLDLNLDPFSVAVLGLVNSPGFNNFAGALDATGQATAQLVVPPLPGVTGVNLWFAYAQDSVTGYDFASETLPLLLR